MLRLHHHLSQSKNCQMIAHDIEIKQPMHVLTNSLCHTAYVLWQQKLLLLEQLDLQKYKKFVCI